MHLTPLEHAAVALAIQIILSLITDNIWIALHGERLASHHNRKRPRPERRLG